jgi:hypothetical protein
VTTLGQRLDQRRSDQTVSTQHKLTHVYLCEPPNALRDLHFF